MTIHGKDLSNMKILWIDDEEHTVTPLIEHFEDEGHDCTFVDTGTEGIEMIKNNQYDVVMLDIRMPDDIHGEVFLKKLKDSNLLSKQKIIATSVFPRANDRVTECLKIGACDFIDKFESLAKITETVEKAVRN